MCGGGGMAGVDRYKFPLAVNLPTLIVGKNNKFNHKGLTV
jgi:hypothetical protein